MPRRYGTTADDREDERLLDVAHCDHYDHEGQGAAVPGGGPAPAQRRGRGSVAAGRPRCRALLRALLFPLLVLTSLGLCYSYALQRRLTDLASDLTAATAAVDALRADAAAAARGAAAMNATLANHSAFLARFADQVSNSDVLLRLDALTAAEGEMEDRVEGEMEATKKEIQGVLGETKREIDKSVRNATKQINSQVRTVESDLSVYIRDTNNRFSTESTFMKWQLAGTFVLLGCLISMWHMTSHLRNFNQPAVQRKILAIMWMCPIYSVTSWLSLVMPQYEGALEVVKDLYEAYVIYQFLSFCIAVLGKGDRNAVVELLARRADHLSPPVKCFGWCRKSLYPNYLEDEDVKKRLADDVLMQCQVYAMQFVIMRPLLILTSFVLDRVQYYGPMFGPGSPFDGDAGDGDADGAAGAGGMGDYRSPQFYITILESVTMTVAFTGLLKFYHCVEKDLSWCRPFPKFLCIKGLVFMTFWQGLGLDILATTTDAFRSDDGKEDEVETYARSTQSLLICLEMLGFSIAHFYCFPVEEWQEGYRPVEDTRKFGDNMALGDFVTDLRMILRKKTSTKEKIKPNSDESISASISTVLEEDEELGHADSNEHEVLLSLVENLCQGDPAAVAATAVIATENSGHKEKSSVATPQRSVEESLESLNAPTELRRATALMLGVGLVDENTARLLTNNILDQPIEPGGCLEENSNAEEIAGREEAKHSSEDLDRKEGTINAPTSSLTNASPADVDSAPPPPPAFPPPSPPSTTVLKPSIFTMHAMSPPKD